MPGGQITNLREQARSLGLESQWSEVVKAYYDINHLFGDIIKVTPSSKVVADMALMLVSQGLTVSDLERSETEMRFPESVISMFKGDLGQPMNGWPKFLQEKILKEEKAYTVVPSSLLPVADLLSERKLLEDQIGRLVSDFEFASYLMYPKVFIDYSCFNKEFGPVSILPTVAYFYGLKAGEELQCEFERGKSLVILYQAKSNRDHQSMIEVFFELNGQPRLIKVLDRNSNFILSNRILHKKAIKENLSHFAAPMSGLISSILVCIGQCVKIGDVLFSIEAMKMETVLYSEREGIIDDILVSFGDSIEIGDLLLIFR
ncbi:MAG: pyruvate carboxylase [Candidatus Tokpelaia sp. JSC161]|nr:MAG: pyruvate carboxylase [Candidatus Tokpelaia sp. JSC161]